MGFGKAGSHKPERRVQIAVWALWGLLAIGLGYFATLVDWQNVLARARAADPLWLGLAAAANLLALPFWSLTWVILAHARLRSFWRFMEVQVVSLAAVQSFSLLAGGATAMLLLTRRGRLSAPAALSLLALDQLMTGIVKVMLVALALVFAEPPAWMQHAGLSLLAMMTLAVALLGIADRCQPALLAWASRRSGSLGSGIGFLARSAAHLRALRDPLRSVSAVLLMLARRLLEGLPILCVQKAVGIPVSWELALLVVTALALVTVIPQPPGNAGLYEAAVLLVYRAAGVPADLALAAALLQHAAFLIAALLPGYVVLLVRRPWRRDLTP